MYAQTLGRNAERQADGLRRALVRMADGPGERRDVESAIAAIRFQLDQVSKLAGELSPPPGESLRPGPPSSR